MVRSLTIVDLITGKVVKPPKRFELDPPILRSLAPIFSKLEVSFGELDSPEEDATSFSSDRIDGLIELIETIVLSGDPFDYLGNLVDSFDELVEELHRLPMEVARSDSARIRRQAAVFKNALVVLEELRPQVKALDALKIAIQKHFDFFVYGGLNSKYSPEAEANLLPLSLLRDELFVHFTPQLMDDYLECAKRIARTPFYHKRFELVLDHSEIILHDAKIAELALELEVLSMLESVGSEDEAVLGG
jgi:hypothetical protein